MYNKLKNYIVLPLINTFIARAKPITTFDKAFNYGGTVGNCCTTNMPCIKVLITPKVGGDFIQSKFNF